MQHIRPKHTVILLMCLAIVPFFIHSVKLKEYCGYILRDRELILRRNGGHDMVIKWSMSSGVGPFRQIFMNGIHCKSYFYVEQQL